MIKIISENGKVGASPLISIVVLTYPERKEKFNTLKALILSALERHAEKVEFLSIHSPKGTPKIGAKRQIGLDAVKGAYFVMIDDDDLISENYFDKVIYHIERDAPDCVGYLIECEFKRDGKLDSTASAIVSNQYTGLANNVKHPIHSITQGIYYKNPVRTALAKIVGFENKSFAEDQDFSIALKPYLRKESFINEVLYYYIYDAKTGETRAQRYGDKTLKG